MMYLINVNNTGLFIAANNMTSNAYDKKRLL